MSIFGDKVNIRYIYFSTYKETHRTKNCVVDVAILTEDMKYAEYELNTRKNEVTQTVLSQYHSLMADWQLTPRSKIYFHENVGKKAAARIIFKPVAQQFRIQVRNVTTEGLVRRLCHIHGCFANKYRKRLKKYSNDVKGGKYHLWKVWRKVVDHGACPWITKEYDAYLMKRGYAEIRRRKQILRLGMYYILESNIKSQYDKRSKARKVAAERRKLDTMQKENIAEETRNACALAAPTECSAEDDVGFGVFS